MNEFGMDEFETREPTWLDNVEVVEEVVGSLFVFDWDAVGPWVVVRELAEEPFVENSPVVRKYMGCFETASKAYEFCREVNNVVGAYYLIYRVGGEYS